MSTISDQTYLLRHQYKNARNLEARIGLHARFSTNGHGWHPWVFDHLTPLPAQSRVLELGSGPGQLWAQSLQRVPPGWDVTLSDLSPGMVEEARGNLRHSNHPFTFAVIDAQAIPYGDGSFDAVIANHMLNHVPDRQRAFREIRRVLRPGGRLYAATTGQSHLRELVHLVARIDPALPFQDGVAFTLEDGTQQLSPWFSRIELHHYEDALAITEAAPLIAYVRSTRAGAALAGDRLTRLTAAIEQELAARGTIHVTKATGLLEAWRDAGR
jgi:SAM-dependent methyltransferase